MLEIEDKIISFELFTAQFCCDLGACRGECCVEGNSGAPLDPEEADILAAEWDNYCGYMKPDGLQAIEEQGFAVLDEDGDLTTPLINERECAYSISTDSGTWCAIEKAWSKGVCSFRKPISCHLYPIREARFANGTVGLMYHRWNVCRGAEVLGRRQGEPLYKTLKEAIVRRYGEAFYKALEAAEEIVLKESHAR